MARDRNETREATPCEIPGGTAEQESALHGGIGRLAGPASLGALVFAAILACRNGPAPALASEVDSSGAASMSAGTGAASGGGEELLAQSGQSPTDSAGSGAPPISTDVPAQGSEPAGGASGLSPLLPEVRARFASIRRDPEPDELIRNSHYWVSNENSHFLWHDDLEGLGGALMGVGTDQNYLFAGWARSELLVLLDFDQAIADLHLVYQAVFSLEETPESFRTRWCEEESEVVIARLRELLPDEESNEGPLEAYDTAQGTVCRRLRRVARQYEDLGVATFLTDQGQYDHVRALWSTGRVFPVRGDLTGDNAMMDMARALRESGMDLRVLYLSNAEQYFDYEAEFRRNMLVQPFGERSITVRTLGWSLFGFVEGEEYHYNRGPSRVFAEWMRTDDVARLGRLLRARTETEIAGSSLLDVPPEPSERTPEVAPLPEWAAP